MEPEIPNEPSPPAQERQLPLSARMTASLAELHSSAAPSQAPRLVNELLDAERRGQSYLAFVPFVGPWLVIRSEVHTPAEKRLLWLVAVVVTVVALALIVAVLPSTGDGAAAIHARVEANFRELAAFAERYRAKHHAYPNPPAWKHFAEEADPRFFDPWGRPYRYEPGDHRAVLRTYGRDGVEGGIGEDADLSFDLSAGPAE